MAQKMKSSEKIALAALVIGIAGCLFLKLYFTLPWLPSIIVGALAAGGSYQTLLQLGANESIVDSKTVNHK